MSTSSPTNDFDEEIASIRSDIADRDEAFKDFASEFSSSLSELSTGLVERQDRIFETLQQQQQGLFEMFQDGQQSGGSSLPVLPAVAAVVGVIVIAVVSD